MLDKSVEISTLTCWVGYYRPFLLSRADITTCQWALTTLGKSASRAGLWHVMDFVGNNMQNNRWVLT